MKTFSMPVFMSSLSVSFALGFILALKVVDVETPEPSAAASRTPVPLPASGNQVADLWNHTGTQAAPAQPYAAPQPAQPSAPVSLDEQHLREMAQKDPIYLRNLIQRYEAEHKPEVKEMIKSVLASIPKPEVLAFFTRLANSSNPVQRKEGYAMLQQMAPDSAEMRNLLVQALTTEQSPENLVQAVAALQPAAVDPREANAIISQLGILAQHADPAVRSQSILQLAQWDKTGASHNRLTQALADPAQEVRQAAIFAIAQSGVRNDDVKLALLNVINSASESRATKGSALQVLERFQLSKDEYDRYMQMRAQSGL